MAPGPGQRRRRKTEEGERNVSQGQGPDGGACFSARQQPPVQLRHQRAQQRRTRQGERTVPQGS
jgi:hypothetical protein